MPPEISEEELTALKAAQTERDTWKKEREDAAKKKAATPPPEDDSEEDDEEDDTDDLLSRTRKSGKKSGKDADDTKRLESAIAFNMRSAEFLKTNASILPSEISEVFAQADKERFDSQTEKEAALKSGVIQSFFSVQANVELLTAGQKAKLDDFLKLTKNGKQDKAPDLYEMVFEPAFERLKDTKKAEALTRGHHTNGSFEDAYKKRLMEGSMKRFGLEKTK